MANGCQEEVECTPANELSPLFVGGKGNLIHTVTTLSGVNNGTTFASAPFNKPSEEWTENTVIRPGIWYNMPIEHKDHMSWLGVGEDKDTYIKYNKDMLDSFRKLADG